MAVLTAIAIGSMIAGTIISARAAAKAAKEQQRANEFNAVEATRQASDAVQRGQEEGNVMRREVRALEGTQKTGYAAQGVDLQSGTPAALQRSTEGLLASDLTRIRRNAEREALGFTHEAAEQRRQGTYARSAGRYNVAATLLGGASQTSLLASRTWGSKKERGVT